ncbi:NERD domain-containing protein [Paenibacillus zeisoli]|uniref:NERD domain-containing protein n=1 Tax=Paenibacillus zeisoli TaxID=2496267 RepID=A0A3S1D8A6_9BACL|nr:nuclease-related domain-containing protein [Paenibacillus zeisoli]RUT30509.1 NERD domain-containing protein [Paenibacillus zeisoli]
MIKKLLAMFKSSNTPTKQAPQKKSTPRKKIEPTRIGELGEHKINIQLDQLPKECKYLSDLLVPNSKSRSGYSQIDHLVISPYALFVIETKNYNGEIKGKKSEKYWSVSNRFKMYNPFMQNFGHIKAVEAHISEFKNLRYISMISFTMRCRFSVDPELRKISSDELIVYDVELSEFIQRKITRIKAEQPTNLLTDTEINQIYEKLKEANITDPKVRAEHIEKAKKPKA